MLRWGRMRWAGIECGGMGCGWVGWDETGLRCCLVCDDLGWYGMT